MFKKSHLVIGVLSLASIMLVADFADARGKRGRRGGRGGGGCCEQVYVDHHCGHAGYGAYPGYAGSPMLYNDLSTTPRTSFYLPSTTENSQDPLLPARNSAMIRVILPDPQAKVWFDGAPTQQMGPDRMFHSPPLQGTGSNVYRIRASWMQGGREVTQERTVNVTPGRMTLVDFVRPSGEQVGSGEQQSVQPGQQPERREYEGKIIRTGQDQFVIETRDNRQVTLYTNPQTRFTLNNKTGAFSDVRVGSMITTGYTVQGDRHIANTVTIRP